MPSSPTHSRSGAIVDAPQKTSAPASGRLQLQVEETITSTGRSLLFCLYSSTYLSLRFSGFKEVSETDALLDLFNSTKGNVGFLFAAHFRTWLEEKARMEQGSSPLLLGWCILLLLIFFVSWKGIKLNASGKVVEVRLGNNKLAGTIPESIVCNFISSVF